MTEIEQAIKYWEKFKQESVEMIAKGKDRNDILAKQVSMCDITLAALREQADFVRCKYCEYWQDNNGGYPNEECRWGHDETPDADDFCSFGKRLEVEHE
jgi:hypothetical protein